MANLPRQMTKPQSQYAPGLGKSQYGSIGNVSQVSAGPAPTSKPPTPPQNRYQSGTLNRSKGEYRTPPVVAPPQVPSNYAPNYPRGSRGQQYGTLPHPQVGMVQPQPQAHDGGSTMPRLSSNSMRSTISANSGASSTPPMSHDHYGTYGLSRKTSSSSADTDHNTYGLVRQTSQASSVSQYGMTRGNTPPGMSRPAQRPPSPPLPTPPQQAVYSRQHSDGAMPGGGSVYGTRAQPDPNVYGTRAQPDPSVYGTRGQPDMGGGVYGTRAQPDMTGNVYGTRGAPDSVYMSRGQVQHMTADPTYGTRAPTQESMYSTRSKLAEQQGYNRLVSFIFS